MKKQIFSSLTILALCFCVFGFMGCKLSPCKMPTAVTLSDEFIKMVVPLKDGTFAVYCNLEGNLTVSGVPIEIGDNKNLPNWPVARWVNEDGTELEYIFARKDSCGYYFKLTAGNHVMKFSVTNLSDNPDDFTVCSFINAGSFAGDADEDELYFDPAML